MSDIIDAATPTSAEPARQPPRTDVGTETMISPGYRDLARWAQGFSYIFWGLLAVLFTIAETLGLPSFAAYAPEGFEPVHRLMLDLYSVTIGGAGVFGLVMGCWRLYQTRDLGRSWKSCSLGLLVLSIAVAYLFPFFCMWRRVPANPYLFAHVVAWGIALIGEMSLLSVAIGVLARRTGHSSLAVQAALYGAVTFIVLFTPFAPLALQLIQITRVGGNPLVALQFLLTNIPPAYVFVVLLPLALTLSLAWAAKDIAMRQLTAGEK
jgi:uncharacterized protein (DUF486 family)